MIDRRRTRSQSRSRDKQEQETRRPDPKKPRRIITVRGSGYVFARKQDADA